MGTSEMPALDGMLKNVLLTYVMAAIAVGMFVVAPIELLYPEGGKLTTYLTVRVILWLVVGISAASTAVTNFNMTKRR